MDRIDRPPFGPALPIPLEPESAVNVPFAYTGDPTEDGRRMPADDPVYFVREATYEPTPGLSLSGFVPEEPPAPVSSGSNSPRISAEPRPEPPYAEIASPDDVIRAVASLGKTVAEASVLVSSGAVYATLGNDVRPPRDIDLIVPYDAYAYLREQPGWDESSSGFLENGRIEVGIEGWGHIPLGALKQRSSQQDGVNVASLSDTINWKTWGRGNEKDQSDIAAIRDRLLDPARPPLPSRFTQDEIAIASSCLPEELRDHPDAQAAIELAANGLATVRALYGDGRIGRPNYIVGLLERPEYKAIATYHNGFDLPEDMHNLQRHLKNIGATPEQHFEALAAEPYTDIIYGNGRQRNNPESYDELRSANLLAAHALTKGYSPEAAMRRCKIVLGTTFDQKTGRQLGRHDPDPVVRAVAGIDLHGLSNPSAEQQADLAIEDGTSARWSLNRTLGRAAEELGVVIGSTDEGLAFTDEYPDFRPSETPQGPTVKEFLAGHIEGSGDFADPETGYQAPDGWTLEDKPARAAKAARLRDVSVRFRAGEITAQQAAQELRAFNPPRTKS